MSLARDLRHGIRSLGKSPVFTTVAVLSLALGIGANTAVFTMLDHVLLHQLPVRNPGELVQLTTEGQHYGSNTGLNAFSYPMYEDFRGQNQVFSGIFCRFERPFSVSFGGNNERTTGELVSGTYFSVFGVHPALGRLFTPEEDRSRGGAPLAVLGYDYWKTRFSGDPYILGKQIVVNDHKLTVIGVAEKGFEGDERLFPTQIYAPIMMAKELTTELNPFDNRRRRWIQVFGRLKPGVPPATARASLQTIFHRVLELEVQQKEFAHASAYRREQFLKMTLNLLPGGGGENVAQRFLEAPLWAMMAMVGLVLLIACANVANLHLAVSSSST